MYVSGLGTWNPAASIPAAMAQTAFILILTEDEDAGRRLRAVLRDKHGHSCSVVAGLSDALDRAAKECSG